VATHRIAQTETEAAEQHHPEKKAQQQHRAQRYFRIGPALGRLPHFLVIDFVH
jgi:hypothetical protein